MFTEGEKKFDVINEFCIEAFSLEANIKLEAVRPRKNLVTQLCGHPISWKTEEVPLFRSYVTVLVRPSNFLSPIVFLLFVIRWFTRGWVGQNYGWHQLRNLL